MVAQSACARSAGRDGDGGVAAVAGGSVEGCFPGLELENTALLHDTARECPIRSRLRARGLRKHAFRIRVPTNGSRNRTIGRPCGQNRREPRLRANSRAVRVKSSAIRVPAGSLRLFSRALSAISRGIGQSRVIFGEIAMYMDHPNPSQTETVPISLRLYIGVNNASALAGKKRWQIVEEAIDAWLRKNEPDALDEPAYAGYQWKNLFLPHGSVLRTVFNGKSHHCHVEGDRIVYEGSTLTPSGFVNAVGGVRRNAWKSIWVLLPDAHRWQQADTMRVRRRAPRKVGNEACARARPPAGQCATPVRPLAVQDAPSAPACAVPRDIASSASPEVAPSSPPAAASLAGAPSAAAPPPDAAPVPRIAPCAPLQAAAGPTGALPEPAARHAAQAPQSLIGWVRKPRPRRSLAGSARRLLDLLRHELLPLRPA